MRAAVLCVLASLALAAPAAAQPAAPYPTQGRIDGVQRMNPQDLPPVRVDAPRERPRPSGYWTGYRPGKHGAYRWSLLGVGVGVLGLTVLLVIRFLRRSRGRTVGRKRPAAVTS